MLYWEFEKTPSSTKGDLRMGCWKAIFPHSRHHTSNHQQSATMKNGREKKKLASSPLVLLPPHRPTGAPKSKVLNPVFRLQGDGFRLQARATSSYSSPIICWCLAPRTAFLDTWMLRWREWLFKINCSNDLHPPRGCGLFWASLAQKPVDRLQPALKWWPLHII
jgi:hypothetical protein